MTLIQNRPQIININNQFNIDYNKPVDPILISDEMVERILDDLSLLEQNATELPSLIPQFPPQQLVGSSWSSNLTDIRASLGSIGKEGVAAGETARAWGDPHFEDADGGKFDLQGEAGKTYNLLNDTGLALNARFDPYSGGTTIMGETGLTLSGLNGSSQIQYTKDGKATLNGQEIKAGALESLADGGILNLSQDGKTLTIKTAEGYTLTQIADGTALDVRVQSPNSGVATDARMPGGLLGQTFDADTLARNGMDNQGKGAIEGTYKDYEVGTLLGEIPGQIQQGISNTTLMQIASFFQMAQITPPSFLPTQNPFNGSSINWNQAGNISTIMPQLQSFQFSAQQLGLNSNIPGFETQMSADFIQAQINQQIANQSMNFMIQNNERQATLQNISATEEKSKKLEQMLMTLLKSGKIDLAMLLISQIESDQARNIVTALTKQLYQAQASRRQLTSQMGQIQGNAQNMQNVQGGLANVQLGLQEVGDTIQMLTMMIKDVNDQKNRTIEFSNNYLSSEHQTTMSLVRGMRA